MVRHSIWALVICIFGAFCYFRGAISFIKYFIKDNQQNRDALPMATLYSFCGLFWQQIGLYFAVTALPPKTGNVNCAATELAHFIGAIIVNTFAAFWMSSMKKYAADMNN